MGVDTMRQLTNYTEETVNRYLDKWLKEADVCQCDDCRLDITAIMLNSLPPKYVVTEKGALWAQMDDDFDPQHRIDFMTILTKAVKIVNNSPRHTS